MWIPQYYISKRIKTVVTLGDQDRLNKPPDYGFYFKSYLNLFPLFYFVRTQLYKLGVSQNVGIYGVGSPSVYVLLSLVNE